MERVHCGIGHARGYRPGIGGKRADCRRSHTVVGDSMRFGRPVLCQEMLVSSRSLARECDCSNQCGRRESRFDHFVSPYDDRSQVSRVNGGERRRLRNSSSRAFNETRASSVRHGDGGLIAGVIGDVDVPDGQITSFRLIRFVQPCSQKYFALSEGQISSMVCAVLAHPEGRIAIVTDVGRGCDGRMDALTNARHADGEGVWS